MTALHHQSMRTITLLLLGMTVVWAEEAAAWRTWSVEDGFAEAFVRTVVVGPDAKVWINHGHIDSMNFLDGYQVQSIPAPPNLRQELWIGQGNLLWGHAETAGLMYRQDEKWTPINRNDKLALPLTPDRVLLSSADKLTSFNPRTGSETVLKRADKTALGRFWQVIANHAGGIFVLGEYGVARAALYGSNWEDYDFGSLGLVSASQPFEVSSGELYVTTLRKDGVGQTLIRLRLLKPPGIERSNYE